MSSDDEQEIEKRKQDKKVREAAQAVVSIEEEKNNEVRR